jgi:hypothetical protein
MHGHVLTFAATDVASETIEYTPTCVVHLIAFGIGDPESDGHCWTFSRSFDDDDWGVCTVREIQQATLYEGIASLHFYRAGLECKFTPAGAAVAGIGVLRIRFEIEDEAWDQLAAIARTIFRDRDYFRCEA